MNSIYKLNSNFDLILNESSNISLVLESSNIEINYELSNGVYNILVFNNTNDNVNLVEKGIITNSNTKITYIELNDYAYNQTTLIDVYKDSSLYVNSIYLGINKKTIKYDIYNKEYESLVNINNNVVCLNDASFELEIVGNIVKGAKNSKCYQKSQCLTFEAPKIAKVLPVLNIDENDVEASHSLSSGTIDEEVLFYMNSRGLSKKDALSLLLVSYLMPSEEFYNIFVDGLLIKEYAERKVANLCMM